MVRATCGVHLKDRKRSTDVIIMPGLKETIDQLAKEEGEVKGRRGGQRKKGRSK